MSATSKQAGVMWSLAQVVSIISIIVRSARSIDMTAASGATQKCTLPTEHDPDWGDVIRVHDNLKVGGGNSAAHNKSVLEKQANLWGEGIGVGRAGHR